jgi:hypothetical protein
MAIVKFIDDHADYRILDGNDLRRHADVTGFHKTEFPEGVETEVSDDVAQALVSNPDIFGKFEIVEAAEEEVAEEEAPKSAKSSKG